MNYKKLGLKCGIEIHQQLEGKKLFCNCPTQLRDDIPDFTIRRKLRAVAGEGGKVDVAAQQEQLRNKTFVYQGFNDTTCLVETDSEPPHEVNPTALYTCLQLCKIVKAQISPLVQVMRKTVVDGSNTSGFQRTALIARGGKVSTDEGDVRIENISLEEDACKIVSKTNMEKTYCLDRLGIPLIEIGTAPDIKSPEQCQETARNLGMLLRSLPNVKRGLGTIRQDVNVSIAEGERVEIKGAQDLRMIPLLVNLEVKRQEELIKLRTELKKQKKNKINKLEIIDLTETIAESSSKIIIKTIKNEGKILGIKLKGFSGLVGRELQPNYRLGTEFAGRAKAKAGVGGIFHSDEMPNYGITEEEVIKISKKLGCLKTDAFILVADQEEKAKIAIVAVHERAEELFVGIPKEVRKAQDDGTSRFMRPMSTSARMYPETDVPLIKPSTKGLKLPELIIDKVKRYQREFNLNHDLANFVIKSNKVELFEELVGKYQKIKPAFIVETLTSAPLEIKRKYQLESNKLTNDHFKDLFKFLHEEKINKDIILDVLIDMIKGKFDVKNYTSLSTEKIRATIEEIVEKNKSAPIGALMGMCMKTLAGKASGKVISEILRELAMKK